ncbi:pyruvate kinase PKM, partial [Caerostris extrusa]
MSCKEVVKLQREQDYTLLDHLSVLDIDAPPSNCRLTGIICTIGPSSRDVSMLVDMINAGMNIARMNFSHGTHDYHAGTIENVREAVKIVSEQLGIASYPVAIALDTKGPEIRTGLLCGGPSAEVEIKKDNQVKIVTADEYKEKCSADIIHVDYKNITKVLVPGNKIYIDDGLISLVVEKV